MVALLAILIINIIYGISSVSTARYHVTHTVQQYEVSGCEKKITAILRSAHFYNKHMDAACKKSKKQVYHINLSKNVS